MADPALLGDLEDFQAWCRGDTRVEGTRHYNALAAIDRYQLFKRKQLDDTQTLLVHRSDDCEE